MVEAPPVPRRRLPTDAAAGELT